MRSVSGDRLLHFPLRGLAVTLIRIRSQGGAEHASKNGVNPCENQVDEDIVVRSVNGDRSLHFPLRVLAVTLKIMMSFAIFEVMPYDPKIRVCGRADAFLQFADLLEAVGDKGGKRSG